MRLILSADYGEGIPEYDDNDKEEESLNIGNEVDRVDADKKNENTHEEISHTDPDNLKEKLECGTDHGCAHNCVVVDNTIKCACRDGFYLDETNGKTCLGKFFTIIQPFQSFNFHSKLRFVRIFYRTSAAPVWLGIAHNNLVLCHVMSRSINYQTSDLSSPFPIDNSDASTRC